MTGKRELYEDIKNARFLYSPNDKNFAKWLVKNFKVDYIGDGTAISVKIAPDDLYLNVNAHRGEITLSDFTDNREVIKKVLETIKEMTS